MIRVRITDNQGKIINVELKPLHKLLCGDSTKEEDLSKLMNDGKADCVITDPPYNLNISSTTNKHLKIKNDNMTEKDFKEFIQKYWLNQLGFVKKSAHYYVFCDWRIYPLFFYIIRETMKIHNLLVWNKPNILMGRNYRYKHELCIFASLLKSIMFDNKSCSNVLDYHSPSSAGFFKELETDIEKIGSNWLTEKNKLLVHPTMKPVTMIEYFIGNSTRKSNIILDCFLGSGTTLIACEKKQRQCYGIEIDPRYVDVCCERFFKFTGIEPVRESDRKKWSELNNQDEN